MAGAASPEPGAGAAGAAAEPAPTGETRQRLAVTADFLNKSLSIVDVAKLTEGATREDALVGTVDLSAYSPGPLAFGITPDGKTAIVSISAGWLGAFTTVPAGEDMVVFVDLEKREVSGELYTGAGPMGVAISHDGKRAFVGQFSENYFAMIDIEKRTFERVSTGSSYNEELAIDDTGTVGILTYGPAGNVVTFSVADPMGTLGNTVGLSSDAAGVAFFPGTKQAFLVQAPTALTGNVGGYNVINAEDPSAPVSTDDVRINMSPTWYPVATMHKRQSVAFPMFENGMLSVREMKLEAGKAQEVQTVPVGPTDNMAYGVTEDPSGRTLLAVQGQHFVGVVDLETKKAFTVPWGLSELGPTEIRMIP